MRLHRRLAAILLILALLAGGSSLAAERNVLMGDTFMRKAVKDMLGEREETGVNRFDTLGNADVCRYCIRSITFLDSLRNAPPGAWDVSRDGDGSVLAWVVPCDEGVHLKIDINDFVSLIGEVYSYDPLDLYIAANGPVSVDRDASFMFAYYLNLEAIHMNGNFSTSNARSMVGMFHSCISLEEVDLSEFDTSQVREMCAMFFKCESLQELDLSAFDTRNVRDMALMFQGCSALRTLDLTSFSTGKVQDMRGMFMECESLEDLRSSENFIIREGTSTQDMFEGTRLAGGN